MNNRKLLITIISLFILVAAVGIYLALRAGSDNNITQEPPVAEVPGENTGVENYATYNGENVMFAHPVDWKPTRAKLTPGTTQELIDLGIPGVEGDQTLGFSAVDDIRPNDIDREGMIIVDGKQGTKWVRKGEGYVSYDYTVQVVNTFVVHVTVPREDPALEAELDRLVSTVRFRGAESISPAVNIVKQQLASSLGISEDEIELAGLEETEWPNSCLGLESADEMCAQAIVPGYRVVLRAQGVSYSYRTNLDGSVVKRETGGVIQENL